VNLNELEKQVNIIINKDNLSVSDKIISNYLHREIEKNIRFINAFSKSETNESKISEAKINISKLNVLLEKLIDLQKISITDMIKVVSKLVAQNPNKFNQDDFLLIESLHDAFLHLTVILSKVDESKNIPKKEEFLNFKQSLDYMDKTLYDLSCYSFWDNPINGLVINNDRKRYLNRNNQFHAVMQSVNDDVFISWFSPNFT
jgi:hypothetical protein